MAAIIKARRCNAWFSRCLCAMFLAVGLGLSASAIAAQTEFPLTVPELAETLPLIHADQVHRLGITGKGTAVAVIDIFSPNPNDPCGFAQIGRASCRERV